MFGLVGWIEDARDAAGLAQSHVLPGLAGVGRLVDAVAHHVAVANDPRLAGADPDDVGIGIGDGNGADRRDGLIVEDRHERLAAVGGLPHAAGRGAEIVGVGIAGHARDGRDSAGRRGPHVAELQRLRRARLLRTGQARRAERARRRQSRSTQPARDLRHGDNCASSTPQTEPLARLHEPGRPADGRDPGNRGVDSIPRESANYSAGDLLWGIRVGRWRSCRPPRRLNRSSRTRRGAA